MRFLRLEEGKDIDVMGLAAELVSLGYTRTAAVENKGQFALRGDILDIFRVGSENPARVDLFGDTVEKIKPDNFLTGERLAQASVLDVVAATDVEIGQDEMLSLIHILEKHGSKRRSRCEREKFESGRRLYKSRT